MSPICSDSPFLVEKCYEIFNDNMCTLDARLKSFQNWSRNIKQQPKELAECGFYFSGVDDKVICFYCGIGLHHWLPEDNPWIEHAIHRSDCTYLLLNKCRATTQPSVSDGFKKALVRGCHNLILRFKKMFAKIVNYLIS